MTTIAMVGVAVKFVCSLYVCGDDEVADAARRLGSQL